MPSDADLGKDCETRETFMPADCSGAGLATVLETRAASRELVSNLKRSNCSMPSRAGYPSRNGRRADVAASEFWSHETSTYVLSKSGEGSRTSDDMIALYDDWTRQYPIASIEDGLAESDWAGWARLTTALGSRVQLVGDDVFVTNPAILRRGIEGTSPSMLSGQPIERCRNARAVAIARRAGYASVMSHVPVNEDATIADRAVATPWSIKTGSATVPTAPEYNQ